MSKTENSQKRIKLLYQALMILGILGFFYSQVVVGNSTAEKVLRPYYKGDALMENVISGKIQPERQLSQKHLAILRNQYELLDNKKDHHMAIAKMMNKYYFAATLCLAITSIILGSMLLRIADNGMKDKSPRFKSIFYMMLCFSTFFLVLIQSLDHKDNIESNTASFLAYSSTQMRIYNYISTGGKADLIESDSTAGQTEKFIQSINKEINTLNNITFGIDHEQIRKPSEIISY